MRYSPLIRSLASVLLIAGLFPVVVVVTLLAGPPGQRAPKGYPSSVEVDDDQPGPDANDELRASARRLRERVEEELAPSQSGAPSSRSRDEAFVPTVSPLGMLRQQESRERDGSWRTPFRGDDYQAPRARHREAVR